MDAGLISSTVWLLEGKTLRRKETLTAKMPLKIRRLWLAIPSPNSHLETVENGSSRVDRLSSNGVTLDVQVRHSDWPVKISAIATGDDALGKGDRGAIPAHLILESRNISLAPGTPEDWEIMLSVE